MLVFRVGTGPPSRPHLTNNVRSYGLWNPRVFVREAMAKLN